MARLDKLIALLDDDAVREPTVTHSAAVEKSGTAVMTRDYVLWNLREAADELLRTIKDIEQDREYNSPEFGVAMQHLYHHLNTAWNARDASPERVAVCSLKDFARWRQSPSDIDLSVAP